MNIDKEKNKQEIISLLRSTERAGIYKIIENLESNGFYEAPASTKFHLCQSGGLAQHSLNVYRTAVVLREGMLTLKEDLQNLLNGNSLIISCLLHDVCKSNVYKPVIKRQRLPDGRWVDAPGYDVDYSSMPLGHGEKSVIQLLRWGLDLTDDEVIAIRWHMNAWDLPFQSPEHKSNMNAAKEHCPLLALLQAADGLSSALLESSQ